MLADARRNAVRRIRDGTSRNVIRARQGWSPERIQISGMAAALRCTHRSGFQDSSSAQLLREAALQIRKVSLRLHLQSARPVIRGQA
jgi:hypothetical protein